MSISLMAGNRIMIWNAECLEALKQVPDNYADSIVTDPPYGLSKEPDMAEVMKHWLAGDDYVHRGNGFMGKSWDSFVPGPSVWRECYRILRPGGHLLSFAGSRTHDLMGLSIRLAGFEIRDSIAWLYGSGFPKSLNVTKAIASGGGRPEDIRRLTMGDDYEPSGRGRVNYDHGAASAMNGSTAEVAMPAEAQQWQGWGTALKPAFEPIVVGRKPLTGTVAANVLEHGTGGLNIDGCRIGDEARHNPAAANKPGGASLNMSSVGMPQGVDGRDAVGRWPTNVVLDESQAAELDAQTGVLTSGKVAPGGFSGAYKAKVYGKYARNEIRPETVYGDSGGASRFFPVFRYQAKAPTKERPKDADGKGHPTVKPLELMRWLVRLVTPPGGLVLDPFAGSGTTGEAALLEGFRCLLIEQGEEYIPLIKQRVDRSSGEAA